MICIFNAVICIKYCFAVPRGDLKINLLPVLQPNVSIAPYLSLPFAFALSIPDIIVSALQSR